MHSGVHVLWMYARVSGTSQGLNAYVFDCVRHLGQVLGSLQLRAESFMTPLSIATQVVWA